MANQTSTSRTTTLPTAKRRKLADDNRHFLLPGLPDHIAHLCLSLISPSVLYSVCRSWRRLIYSAIFPPFRSIYTLSLTAGGGRRNQALKFLSFDPISSKWITVDSPLLSPYLHRISVRQPSFIARNLPIQSVSISGNLVLIAATSVHRNSPTPAFPHPLIFNPLSNTWSSGPPLSTPRRWCAAGVCQDTVVVASGIGSNYTETVARSVEKWVFQNIESFDQKRSGNLENIQSLRKSNVKIESFDKNGKNPEGNFEKIRSFDKISPENCDKIRYLGNSKVKIESLEKNVKTPYGNCEKIRPLHNSTIQIESFDKNRKNPDGNLEKIRSLRNSNLKTDSFIEISNGNWEKMQLLKNSKLCREPIDAIGFKRKLCMVNVKGDFTKEGFIYNLDSDEWSEMRAGMLGGWRGPAAAMDEEIIYVVDETKGMLKKYNDDVDNWSEIMSDERLKTAEYIAAGGGRVCIVCEKVGILVVDVMATPPRLWVVETPPGDEILGIHILPRLCLPEFQCPVSVLESKE